MIRHSPLRFEELNMSSLATPACSAVDLALESLQEERAACVARLRKALDDAEHQAEVSGYLRRIDSINAALVRLAGARLGERDH
jgi:hypothetical protein